MESLQEFGIVSSLRDFWTQVESVFTTGFLGQPIGKGVLALAILAVAFLLRGLIAKIIAVTIGKLAGRTETDFDDQLVDALKKPLTLLPLAAGVFFAAQALGASGEVDVIVANITRSILIIAVFWALFRVVDPVLGLLRRMRRVLGETFLDWMKRIVKGIIFFIGGAAVLDVWGVPVLPFLASLSLLSVAVALGAQDLFKNLIGGMTIIGERRLSKGDWISVDGVVEGIVEDVSFRSTTVRRFDKAPVYVPNAKLADNPLINFSRMTHRRIYWKIGLEYRTTDEQLANIRTAIEEYITSNDDFAPAADVSTFVHVDEFSDSSVTIMVYCFTKTTTWGEWLAIKEQLAFFIKKTVEAEEAGFAFPSRSLYFEKLPDGFAPENFQPPGNDSDAADDEAGVSDEEGAEDVDQGDIPDKHKSASTEPSRQRGATRRRGPHPHGRGVDAEDGGEGE
ncbi:mechanosensitive ion channel family protein [Henriciella aquimarina]|uniref:mechanosensitive ion channel family protein n=1 Tax=Henriciella aquimarina TaxID=545261 RepID=UPI0009FD59D5|nr:mechanosensitive ion channel family protein [Henriciella aquimarina]